MLTEYGSGPQSIAAWLRVPLVTILRLLGAMTVRHNPKGKGGGPPKGRPDSDDANIIEMLEKRRAQMREEEQRENPGRPQPPADRPPPVTRFEVSL